jgi:hypothetical protein
LPSQLQSQSAWSKILVIKPNIPLVIIFIFIFILFIIFYFGSGFGFGFDFDFGFGFGFGFNFNLKFNLNFGLSLSFGFGFNSNSHLHHYLITMDSNNYWHGMTCSILYPNYHRIGDATVCSDPQCRLSCNRI